MRDKQNTKHDETTDRSRYMRNGRVPMHTPEQTKAGDKHTGGNRGNDESPPEPTQSDSEKLSMNKNKNTGMSLFIFTDS